MSPVTHRRWLPRGKLQAHHRLAWKAFHLCSSSSSSLMNCVSWLWGLQPYRAVNPWVPAGSDLGLPLPSSCCLKTQGLAVAINLDFSKSVFFPLQPLRAPTHSYT